MADDVRELLLSTTADADPSTPLSAPDLRLLIDRLRIRSDRLHASALSFASSHRAPLAAALLRAADSSASSSSLESSLASALAPLSSSPGLSDLRELSDRLLAARRELRERQEHLAARRSLLPCRHRRSLPAVPGWQLLVLADETTPPDWSHAGLRCSRTLTRRASGSAPSPSSSRIATPTRLLPTSS